MKILEYIGLDTSRVKASYRKVVDAIARDDFRAAQVKKLVSLTHGKSYRAKLDDADRLLFVSDHRAEFSQIVDGVDKASLAADTLDYRRAKDKSDKSLEVYKFFVNAISMASSIVL